MTTTHIIGSGSKRKKIKIFNSPADYFNSPEFKEEQRLNEQKLKNANLGRNISESSILDLIMHSSFYYYNRQENSAGKNIGLAVSLEEAEKETSSKGFIANMPALVAGIGNVDKDHYYRSNGFSALSEENIGVDKKGLFVKAGKQVVVVVHGGGIINSKRIFQAYSEGLSSTDTVKYTDEEFDSLLLGKLPDGNTINIYTIEDLRKDLVKEVFDRYAVVLALDDINNSLDFIIKKNFMEDLLTLARVGTLRYLEQYFDNLRCTVNPRDFLYDPSCSVPTGNILRTSISGGMGNNYHLHNPGAFVGIFFNKEDRNK